MVTVADGRNESKSGRTDGKKELRPGSILDLHAKTFAAKTTPRGRHLLHVLAIHHNEATGQCNPSHATLAAETGYSERTIRKILKEDLAKLVTYQHGKYSNDYTLFPPMLVSSPAPGEYLVAHVDTGPSLGTRGPAENHSHSEHGGRVTRNTGAGSLGTRGPGNIPRTHQEHFGEGPQQKSCSPQKAKPTTPAVEAVQAALEARGFPPEQAGREAARFMAYNEAKGWRLEWEKGVERWTAKEPESPAAAYKPRSHNLYVPPAVEEHTPAQAAKHVQLLRQLQVDLASQKGGGHGIHRRAQSRITVSPQVPRQASGSGEDPGRAASLGAEDAGARTKTPLA